MQRAVSQFGIALAVAGVVAGGLEGDIAGGAMMLGTGVVALYLSLTEVQQ